MQPLVQIIAVEAVPPSLGDNTADLDRLKKTMRPSLAGRELCISYGRMATVAARFRKAGFRGHAVVNDLPGCLEIVDFFAQEPNVLPGMALDLGTTHLEANLVNLLDGSILAGGHLPNSQINYGVDILSRIHYAARENGLARLHRQVLNSINELAGELADQAGLSREAIRALSVSGNTAMVHFFMKLDPYHLCREPYIPLVNAPDPCRAADLGLHIHSEAVVWILPGVGSYFGGDLISGLLASRLDQAEEICMLIDVGTNAEVVLGNRHWLIACAGAAGPALEGGIARMGMRAGPGAIERVTIDPASGRIDYQTIGNSPPKGICGSGIIDLAAAFYLARIIDIRGKFRMKSSKDRFVDTSDGPAFIVVHGDEAADGEPILFGQVDLDAMIRSKAAMYSILATLMSQVGLEFQDLHHIYVAGAFGRHIDPKQAITLGMLPDLPLSTFEAIGNSSLAGAGQILLERSDRERCVDLIGKITYLELNVNQEFMIRFSGSRFIPHTDHTLFPSVPFFN